MAGANAANQGISFEHFQKVSGALQVGGILGALAAEFFGKEYGSPPNWGEKDYQRTRSEYGYKQQSEENNTIKENKDKAQEDKIKK